MAIGITVSTQDLRRLNLADNSIVELVQRNFFMLTRLKYLDLSGNPLQDLQPDVFRDVPVSVDKRRTQQTRQTRLTHLSLTHFPSPFTVYFTGSESIEMPQLPAEKNQSAIVQFIAALKRIGFGTQRGLCRHAMPRHADPPQTFSNYFLCSAPFLFCSSNSLTRMNFAM